MENGKNIQKIEFYVYPKIIFCFIFVVEPPSRRYIFIMCVVRLVLKHKLKSGSNSKYRQFYIKLNIEKMSHQIDHQIDHGLFRRSFLN